MPKNPFSRALDAATKRMDRAIQERTKAQGRLAELNLEIPNLQRTIVALQQQLHPDSVTFRDSATGKETAVDGTIRVPAIPADLASLVGPQDMTGLGSIPPVQPTEDELLPEPTGVPMSEE